MKRICLAAFAFMVAHPALADATKSLPFGLEKIHLGTSYADAKAALPADAQWVNQHSEASGVTFPGMGSMRALIDHALWSVKSHAWKGCRFDLAFDFFSTGLEKITFSTTGATQACYEAVRTEIEQHFGAATHTPNGNLTWVAAQSKLSLFTFALPSTFAVEITAAVTHPVTVYHVIDMDRDAIGKPPRPPISKDFPYMSPP